MEEKERFSIGIINGILYLYDNFNKYNTEITLKDLSDLLNQQDKHIKELEKIRDKGNQKLENFYNEKIDKLDSDYNKYFDELIEENKQIKQELSDEEKAHNLCIKHFNEECEKLRKQIKFESEARERFKQEIQQLKQSQIQLAISELEKVKYINFNHFVFYKLSPNQAIVKWIDNQIKKLKGNNNE